MFCSTYVQSLNDIYGNLNDGIIDEQIEVDFPRWFQEYVSIDLNKKMMLLFFIISFIYNFYLNRLNKITNLGCKVLVYMTWQGDL